MKELEREMGDEVEFKEVWAHQDMATFNKYGVGATPTIVILDANGSVTYNRSGVPGEELLRSEIEKAKGE